jgi:homoserine acetyltransferase
MVERAILVVSAGELHPWVIVMPGRLAEMAIRLDPNWQNEGYYGKREPLDGLAVAFTVLTMIAKSQPWADRTVGRAPADLGGSPTETLGNRFLIETEIEKAARDRAAQTDADAFYRAGIGYESFSGP